jgi:methyl-accepting chemotaxis protein
MRIIHLSISRLIGASLGLVFVLMASLAGVTWFQLTGISSTTSVAEGRTRSMIKGQDLSEALFRSVALSNAYALTESATDLADAQAANTRLKDMLTEFTEMSAGEGTVLGEMTGAYDKYDSLTKSLFEAINQRRTETDAFNDIANGVTVVNALVVTAIITDHKLHTLSVALKLIEHTTAAAAAVNRYLASHDPAQAETAKDRADALGQSAKILRMLIEDSSAILNLLDAIDAKCVEFGSSIDSLISASQAAERLGKDQQLAADNLVKMISARRQASVAQQDMAMQAVTNSVRLSRLISGSLSVLALMVAILAWQILARRIVSALSRLRGEMQQLADGNLSVEIADLNRSDEIGGMTRALAVFKDNAKAMEQMRADNAAKEKLTAEEKRQAILKLAADFESRVSRVVQDVDTASSHMDGSSKSMASVAEKTSAQTKQASAAAKQALAEVETVSAATEELIASINGIGQQICRSDQVAKMAAERADETARTVGRLAEAAQKIGAVVEIITSIASQTNLLALNATIEAARAGDAGKGFAVVAGEVKHLAGQTGKATGEIADQVTAIQQATEQAVAAIENIVGTIADISKTSTTMAAAVEQQQAATLEISRGVQAATDGTSAIANTLEEVSATAEVGGQEAGHVVSEASKLSATSEELQHEVERFLAYMRQ